MSFITTILMDMLFIVSTFKKSTVKMPGLRSWIFSWKKFEDSLILRIRRGGGTTPGVGGLVTNLSHLFPKNDNSSQYQLTLKSLILLL